MTMDEYTKWLEQRIAIVGTELEILLNARKSMEMAREALNIQKFPLQPKAKTHVPEYPVDAKKRMPSDQWKSVLADIAELIRGVHPEHLSSGDVIARLYPNARTKRDKDRVYTALSYMKTKGELVRSPQGYWSLPQSSAALIAEKING